MDTMNAAEVLVKSLEAEGIKYVFALPGEENLDLLEALRKSSIRVIITRHEQAAGFMAATVGRLTGMPGVAMSTLGPGATNFVTAAAYAHLGAMPMLLITGQKPIKQSKQGSFQVIDTVNMFKPLTKKSQQLISGNLVASAVRNSIKTAIEERPGPVHIELPEDIAGEEVPQSYANIFPIEKIRRPVAEEKAISKAVVMIENARRPLILIGAGANRKLTAKMLKEFVDKTGIPFFNTQMGKGVIDERHSKHLGTAALSSNDFLHCAIEKADLIINVGHDVIEKPPFIMTQDSAQVIHINFYSAHVDNIYFPQLEVVGDIANAIWQINSRIKPNEAWNFSEFEKAQGRLKQQIDRDVDNPSFPIWPQTMVNTVRKSMPEDGILALDNGMYKLWFSRNYPAYAPNTLLLDNALATMGAGLPSGIAAKLINPDKKVVVVAGDGGFMMNSQEIETAVRLGLDLVILLINDNGFGMIKWKQQAQKLTNFGLDYANPDFVKYAESYGAYGYRVTSVAELEQKLAERLSARGVSLIEVPIDYSQNIKVFTEELLDKDCSVE